MNDLTQAAGRHQAESFGPNPLLDHAVMQTEEAKSRLGEMLRFDPAAPDICGGRGPKAHDVPSGQTGPADPAAADPHQSAQRAMFAWRRMEELLAPIIGVGGVGAIYGRSLACARRAFPWLPAVHGLPGSRIEWASLREALARRPASEASSADAMLQQTFGELLASLVGSRLADRLLELSFEAGVGNQRQEENLE